MHASLGEHGVVLDFGFAQRRAVVADDDELGLAGTQRLKGGLVPESVLARPLGLGGGRGERLAGLLSIYHSRIDLWCRVPGHVHWSGTCLPATHLMTICRRPLMPSFCFPFLRETLGSVAGAAAAGALIVWVSTAFLSVWNAAVVCTRRGSAYEVRVQKTGIRGEAKVLRLRKMRCPIFHRGNGSFHFQSRRDLA